MTTASAAAPRSWALLLFALAAAAAAAGASAVPSQTPTPPPPSGVDGEAVACGAGGCGDDEVGLLALRQGRANGTMRQVAGTTGQWSTEVAGCLEECDRLNEGNAHCGRTCYHCKQECMRCTVMFYSTSGCRSPESVVCIKEWLPGDAAEKKWHGGRCENDPMAVSVYGANCKSVEIYDEDDQKKGSSDNVHISSAKMAPEAMNNDEIKSKYCTDLPWDVQEDVGGAYVTLRDQQTWFR